MSALAAWLARRLWAAMLWLMRRPWIKRLQRASVRFIPAGRRVKALQSLHRQNRFARRHGEQLLRFTILLLLASMLITGTYLLALNLYEAGALSVPRPQSVTGAVPSTRP